jgi:hypothetical protein
MELGAGLIYAGHLRDGGFTRRPLEAELLLPRRLEFEEAQDARHSTAPLPARVTHYLSSTDMDPSADLSSDRIDIRSWPSLTAAEENELTPSGTAGAETTAPLASLAPVRKSGPTTYERLRIALTFFRRVQSRQCRRFQANLTIFLA